MSNDHRLPSHAKLAFKGKIFEVWQWEQKMYDGSTEIFERIRRPNTAQVIPVVGDRILVQIEQQPDRAQSFSSLAGGRCDEGEHPLDAAKRELLEETGYVSDDWILWKEQNPVGKMVWTVYTYIAHTCRYHQPPKLDAGEKITNRLISFDEFLTLADDPSFYVKELVEVLLRARYDVKIKEELRQLLFGI